MDISCPHCHKQIDLVGAKELDEEYKVTPNSRAHFAAKGEFPEPMLQFGNRFVYLRSDIEEWKEARKESNIDHMLDLYEQRVGPLSKAQRVAMRKILEDGPGEG